MWKAFERSWKLSGHKQKVPIKMFRSSKILIRETVPLMLWLLSLLFLQDTVLLLVLLWIKLKLKRYILVCTVMVWYLGVKYKELKTENRNEFLRFLIGIKNMFRSVTPLDNPFCGLMFFVTVVPYYLATRFWFEMYKITKSPIFLYWQ